MVWKNWMGYCQWRSWYLNHRELFCIKHLGFFCWRLIHSPWGWYQFWCHYQYWRILRFDHPSITRKNNFLDPPTDHPWNYQRIPFSQTHLKNLAIINNQWWWCKSQQYHRSIIPYIIFFFKYWMLYWNRRWRTKNCEPNKN